MSSNITINAIVSHWQGDALFPAYIRDEQSLESHCWYCHTALPLSITPIIPLALGGNMQPDNLVLLCSPCTHAAPLTKDKSFFLDWLQAHSDYSFHKHAILHAGKLYQAIYKIDLGDILHELDIDTNHLSQYLDDEKRTLCK